MKGISIMYTIIGIYHSVNHQPNKKPHFLEYTNFPNPSKQEAGRDKSLMKAKSKNSLMEKSEGSKSKLSIHRLLTM